MQSPFYKQNKINKVDISLKQLMDVDTTNELAYRRVDNIFPNQVLTSYTNTLRRDAFRFKYLTDLITAGTGVTITNNAGIITIASTGTASPLTTKGDLYTYTTTNARLPVGTNGQILYADSTAATGLKWDAAPSGGGGSGIPYGVASGTNTYAVTISGVTAYTAGDAYTISFTNGNDDDSTININGLGAKLLVKEFDVQLTGGDIVSGQDLIIIYDGTNFQTLGVAPNQLFAYVTNDDSVTINKGQPVYAFGSAGNRMSVKLAYNTSDATSAQTVGVVFSTSIAAGQKGFIITQGVISGLNTAAYSAGAQLYLGSTAGSLTATKPYAPNHIVYIGIVERSNAGNGQIYIKPQNGYELDEIHDVDLVTTPPVNNDVLVFDTSTTPDLWKPKSISTILGYTPVTSARSLTIDGVAYDLSADRSWTTGGNYSAYTMKANNTASAATPSDFTFKDLGEQTLPVTPSWGGTAPTSGTLRYRWFQIGNVVHFHFIFTYTGAGTGNTTLSFNHPSDMPIPVIFSGITASVTFLYRYLSYIATTTNVNPPTGWYGGLKRTATTPSTTYGWQFSGASIAATSWSASGTYYT